MKTIIAEKPSVAREIARIVGATKREEGYFEGGGYAVTWAFGHLVQLAMPDGYGIRGFVRDNLPVIPDSFTLIPRQVKTEKGYKPAGAYVNGVLVEEPGGGVCQVSTTLYNAAILAGMKACEVHAHSLAVGYVEPSFDAMVSDSCDLRLRNDTGGRVYLLASASGGTLTVRVYGRYGGYTYERRSVVLETLEPPAPRLVKEGEAERAAKAGLRSEGYLIRRGKGGEVSVRLRTDKYAPVQGVVSQLPQISGEENFVDSLHLFVKCAKMGRETV